MASHHEPVDDPFAALDSQHTFIRPRPGGARPPPLPEPASSSEPSHDPMVDLPGVDQGLNPLLALANRLLRVLPQIRATRRLDDPAVLRDTLAQGLRQFSRDAATRGLPPEQITAASYILCTVLDEAAAEMPWGSSGAWTGYSLLVMFHNERDGGEKVFRLMARLVENPAANQDLLELIYAALALGFQGRYRVIPNGAVQLDAVRDRLAQMLRQQRGAYPQSLSPHWQGTAGIRRRVPGWLPLLLGGSVLSLVLLLLHLGLALSLGSQSDPVFAHIRELHVPSLALSDSPRAVPVALPVSPRLGRFLEADVQAGRVAVRDEADRSVVTVRGDALFAPGSPILMSGREELLTRIGDALSRVEGLVLVTGHTDSQPIRTLRFPSNWHLSQARAQVIRDLLAARQIDPGRLRAEGRADAEPIAPNDSPGGRALNRRVEIILIATAPARQASGSGS